MSSKGRKQLNRLLRMSGRTCRNQNNARQHVESKRWARDVAAGGMDELQALSAKLIAEQQAEENRKEEELAKQLGLFGREDSIDTVGYFR